VNWFVAGHKIDPDHWYFRPEEGGRVLGNLCHWTDFTLDLVGGDAFPVTISPARHEQSDSNIVVSYVFSDGSVAGIAFSTKGHTFEGVMERLAVHREDCLITMDNYRTMIVREGHRKKTYVNRYRDHGHGANILEAATSVLDSAPQDREAVLHRLRESSRLILGTKEALERNEVVRLR
jgi:predicted dehydrogenase